MNNANFAASSRILPGPIASVTFLAGIAICLVAATVYWFYQPQITAGDGYGWDGRSYAMMYEAGLAGESVSPIQFPFCKRVGLPVLASLLGVGGFAKINVLSGIVAAISVFFVALRRVGWGRSLAVLLPLVFYIFAPVRFANFYPWTVDPPLMALMGLALLAVEFRQIWAAIALLIAGIVVKETSLYFAVIAIACFVSFSKDRSVRQRIVGSVVALGAALVCANAYNLLYPHCDGSALATIIDYGIQALTDPWRILTIVAGVLLTIGPFLGGVHLSELIEKFNSDPLVQFSSISFAVSLAMAALGGSDCTRLFYICFPLYAGLLFVLIGRMSLLEASFLGITGLIANRWLSRIPDPEGYLPDIGSFQGYFVYFPDAANPVVAVSIIVLFLLAYLVLHLAKTWVRGGEEVPR